MPTSAITIRDLVETAAEFNQNYFEMDKKQVRELRRYIKETKEQLQQRQPPSPPPQHQRQQYEEDDDSDSSSSDEDQEHQQPQPTVNTWRTYIRLASTELKSPDSELRATLSNIQKRARELALSDGYVFKNQK
jgi:hypothetical protein